MSHTFTAENGDTIFYNSDLSGEIEIHTHDDQDVYLDANTILEFVAERLRNQQMTRYENMDWQNFVGGLGR